jgi:asparagine synthase (glutamine-hydrolysing)
MSGYTLGRKTIYKDIKRFSSGECSLWIDDVLHRDYYYIYLPFETVKSETQLKQDFLNVSLQALRRTISSVRGRQIVVPLSAGYDSRLIVSGLRELGYENVVCFSYGRKGNYEVRTSKEVARKLDYKWVHVPIKLRSKRSFFLSKVYRDYVDRFESYSSVPNVQEVYEIYKLSLLNIIDKDAVIINGNTGDFISGGHIPLDASKFKKKFSSDEFNWSSFLNKHYSIWRSLRSSFNDKIIISELNKITKSICKSETEVSNYAVMECMEFIGRQSRFVMNQQRSYDFINHDWRLPLWDSEFLNFWESVPLEYKKGQKLYKESLLEANWGGVWVDIPVNNKLIRPFSLMILRLIFKILISPFGKKVWHNLEKNIFVYWMHPSYARSVESYKNVLFDIRGQRNTNSWQADHFVKKYGFQSVADVSSAVKNKIKI